MQYESLRIVPCSQGRDGIAEHLRRTRRLEQKPAVRPAEPKLAVRRSIDLVALLMDGAVVVAAEHREIRERGRASLRPVTNVMPLAEAPSAAREAAAAVSVVERAA